MRELKSSITRALCDQIFTLPIHWPKATNFPETATHAIDFGPGGLSGIGSLTARLLDGCGFRRAVLLLRVKETLSFSIRLISSMNHIGTRSGLLA